MTKAQHFEWLLSLADDALILGQRLSEWCGHAPALEEDIALSNVALDLIGQSRAILTHAGLLEGEGRDEDRLAFFRSDREYRNLLLVELPNGHFGDTIARQFFFDQFAMIRYGHLAQQTFDLEIAAIATKALKEVRYHAAHSAEWMIRLGDGTDLSKTRIQESVDRLWPYIGECFEAHPILDAAITSGAMPDCKSIELTWKERVSAVLAEATLILPTDDWKQVGGRNGLHTEHLSYLLAEMQAVPRLHPDAKW
ncbi:MAG TPA: phenylacetate-CoA oxygenase subunit PaaI [Flavobacteriales bacterium]|nr:phenylacetate-CoA oxygenase subunit PaaI [Flavobacteriales bacterium]